MKKEIFLLILMMIPLVAGISCTTRTGSCNSGEYCLFSKYQLDNSHVGNCSTYSNLVCCSDQFLNKVEVKSSCGLGENGTISMYNYTNAHVEIYTANNYDYKVCVSCPWMCELRNSCLPEEYAIASLNASTNAHVGEPDYYEFKVCCKRENVLPTYYNVGQNSTSIRQGEDVKLYAYFQDNGNISQIILSTNETGFWENKSAYGSPVNLNSNEGWGNFTWSNSSIVNTVVAWRIYANDTCGNSVATEINTFQVQATLLTSCQNISSSGSYVLANNVSASGTCFNITADNVELDCNGYSINYANSKSGYGVFVDRKNNANIKNCKIFSGIHFNSYGIYLNSVNYTKVLQNNVSTSNGYGVFLDSSSNNIVSGNNVSTSNGPGVYLSSSSNNNVSWNNFYTYQGYAIYVYGTNFNHYNHSIDQTNKEYGKPVLYYFNKTNLVIENNETIGEIFVAYSNYTKINNVTLDKDGVVFAYVRYSNVTNSKINIIDYGVYLYSSSNNIVSGNNVSTSSGAGVYLSSSSNNNVSGNNVSTSSGAGVYLDWSSNNIVSGNNVSTINGNGDGVYLDWSSNNIVSGNNVSTFVGYGLALYSSSNNIVSWNNVSTSSGNGVYLSSSSNNIVSWNNVSTSSGNGVYLSASNNNFYNNFIKTVNSYASGVFVVGNSFNITIFNSTIETKKNDIKFRENGSIQLINTTFNKSSVYWESSAKNAWINVSYFIDVYVRNLTDPLESAQVNITNYTNDQVFSGHTESNGYITTQLLPEYFANGSYTYSCPSSQSNITCSSPYNISASKGSLFNYTIEVVNQSKTVEIILFEKIISMMISDKLAEGIFFTSINGSVNNTQLPIQPDRWNNATWNYNNTPSPGDYKTLYWIHNEGNVNQDFCIKADDDLVCSQGECTSNKIPIFNVAFTNSTQNNENYPMFNESARLNTSFIKIAQNVQPDQYVYFRFWLYGNLTGKPSGIYNTTFTVKNVESGTSCN